MFEVGEYVVCVDLKQSPFRGYQKPDIKTLTKGKKYVVLNKNEWSHTITVMNDKGVRLSYSPTRFKSIQKFRSPKIKKLIKRISTNIDI
jgi:hypothetical protein